jgi:hypothetical protein
MTTTRPKGPVTPDEIERMKQLRADGRSVEDVAATVGRCARTITRYAPIGNHPPLTLDEIERMEALRVAGHTNRQIAAALGRAESTVGKHIGPRAVFVSTAPLREAFLNSNRTVADIARHLEWWVSRERLGADVGRVRRTLGLNQDCNGAGRRSWRKRTDIETAFRLAEAIGVEPWEVIDET